MSPIGHLQYGWWFAHWGEFGRGERAAIALAGVGPDLDGLSLLAGGDAFAFRGPMHGHRYRRTWEAPPFQPLLQVLELHIDHRRDVQREELRYHQTADHRQTQWLARVAARA